MIAVHHLNDSRSQRILWLLEELGVRYEVIAYRRDPVTGLAPEALRAVHPLGKSPVVVDGGEVLAESGAIIEYLVERYGNGRLRPAAAGTARQRYLYWLHYAEGSLAPPLSTRFVLEHVPRWPMPDLLRPVVWRIAKSVADRYVEAQIREHLDYIETTLAANLWFVGQDFTAADVAMSFPLEFAVSIGAVGPMRPHLSTWLYRIHQREAYQRALVRGGPYMLSRNGTESVEAEV